MKRITTILSLCLGWLTASAQTENETTIHDEISNQDEVIAWPESMTERVDSMLIHWNAAHYLYPDTNCIEKGNVNPTFAPEVYQERLRRLPTVMEMPYNNIVQECIDRYSTKLRKSVSVMLGAGNYYIPLIEETLDRYNLPLELKYLPIIESALDPTAVSRVGATGLWQIMLPTAQRYGLEVNSLVDERRDPYKSTDAAARYLKDLFKIYGDWNLVIAAYNCGPGNVNKAIHRADGKKDYWAIYPYLPKETRGYVPAFIAANYIMSYYCEHNICPMLAKYPIKTDTIVVNRNVHMKQIEALCGVGLETIKGLNPQYRTEVIPGASEPRTINLPQEKILAFIDHQDSIYNYKADELLTRRATVAVNTKEVARVNKESNNRSNGRAKYVKVRRGDTLGAIASRNHTSVSMIKRLNGMRSDRINPGKRLRVR